jgi:heme-NO-binding protein
VRWFGRAAIPLLAERYPEFFEGHRTTSTFLLTLNDIIHTEVRKLFVGADVPHFDLRAPAAEVVSLGYASSRRLCSLAEGFIEGVAAHFGEKVAIEQTTCMKRGDEGCLLLCSFADAGSGARP